MVIHETLSLYWVPRGHFRARKGLTKGVGPSIYYPSFLTTENFPKVSKRLTLLLIGKN